MPRTSDRQATHMLGDRPLPNDMKQRAKELFARRLYRMILERGWNQADLAREAGLGRDVIHSYINAKSLPTQPSAEKLAAALGVSVAQLYPGGDDSIINIAPVAPAELPAVHMRPLEDGEVFLQINMQMPMARALKLLALLQAGTEPS